MNARASLLAGLSCLALVSTPAAAQDAPSDSYDGNEIIVTATKRDASLQDVPFSINAQTEQAIERANASTIEDLSRNVAGLTVQNLGPGQSQVSVRGVSTRLRSKRSRSGVKSDSEMTDSSR